MTAIYGSSDALTPRAAMLTSDTADDLRKILQTVRRGQVTLRASAVLRLPAPGSAAATSSPTTTLSIRPQITRLNRCVPCPRTQLVHPAADPRVIRSAMAHGSHCRHPQYTALKAIFPITAADGHQILVVQNPRTFRGGLSFIF